MPDLALSFHPDFLDFDLTLEGTDIQGDSGLLTAVIVSLFSDRRAHPDDPLPDERPGVRSDVRGWWGDQLVAEDFSSPSGDDGIGSRLWLLSREKEMAVVVARAQQYAREALEWLLRKKIVQNMHVTASHAGPGHIAITVRLSPLVPTEPGLPAGAGREWNFVYQYSQ